MYRTTLCSILFATAALSGCSTTQTKLNYTAPSGLMPLEPSTPQVFVGTFVDQRGESPTWYGAIRGGFGNPLKKLESEKPISIMVQNAFADGLRSRGLTPGAQSSPLQLSGVIHKLDCSEMVRSESNVEIEVDVIDASTGQQRFSRTYRTSNEEGTVLNMQTGIFASVDGLRALAEKTLGQTVDKALDDSALRASLKAASK
jgi:uncharacterized lipoprotein YajG